MSLFDPGLQPERTALAWRRTVLSIGLGAVVALRLLPPVLGTWSFAIGFAGVAIAGQIWILSARRARRTQVALVGSSRTMPDGRLLFLLTLVVTGAAALGILYVLS